NTAPSVKAQRRASIRPSLAYFCTAILTVPPTMQPISAARKGKGTARAIWLRSKCRTLLKYNGNQKDKVPQVGSARNRGIAIPQKFLCFASFRIEGRVPS